jgi:cytochrome c-type biogenesis protein CcmF
LSALALFLVTGELPIKQWLGLSVILWLFVCSLLGLFFPRVKNIKWNLIEKKLPMVLAHVGLAVCAVGVLLTVSYSRSAILSMKLGERASLPPYSIRLDSISLISGPNYQAQQATISLFKDEKQIGSLHPQQRNYTESGMEIAKTDRMLDHFQDMYLALGAKQPSGQWGVRFYIKPFIYAIWIGGLLMALGSLLAIINKRRVQR